MSDYAPTEVRLVAFRDEFKPILDAVKSGRIKETNLNFINDINNLGQTCVEPWENFKAAVEQAANVDVASDLEPLKSDLKKLGDALKALDRALENADTLNFIDWVKNKVTVLDATVRIDDQPKEQVVEWLREDSGEMKSKYIDKQF